MLHYSFLYLQYFKSLVIFSFGRLLFSESIRVEKSQICHLGESITVCVCDSVVFYCQQVYIKKSLEILLKNKSQLIIENKLLMLNIRQVYRTWCTCARIIKQSEFMEIVRYSLIRITCSSLFIPLMSTV